jgi:uncharacterized protein (UPF0548 family)
MFLLHQPSEDEIRAFVSGQRDEPFSYGPVGITRNPPARGYNVDYNRVKLGDGLLSFKAATKAIRSWQMFNLGWVRLHRRDTPIEAGATVAVVINHLGFWSMNACRIVYVIEESGSLERYGFAYGTLTDHGERGEERFTVEWNREDDSVAYDILAVSRPGPLARLGYPYTRRLQKRFAKDSKRAMIKAVAEAGI